jgi:glutathione synthase/RimK-type ligase-like ATP-grasp enzyme
MRMVGLYREVECSPGLHRSNDARLLDQVAVVLRGHGCGVELTTLSTVAPSRPPDAVIFSMCQGRAALELLSQWEAEGARIINTPRAALNTYRDRLAPLMQDAGIPFPATTLVTTSKGGDAGIDTETLDGGVWLKRGDMHASVAADVQWVDSADRLRVGLKGFAARGIARAALQRHYDGHEIKFYGVAGGRFFHWFYPSKDSDPWRGNGSPGLRCPLDVTALEELAEHASTAAGLDVYGGDVIISPSGELTLIDLNDWPSFAPCRDRAADAIARYLMGRVNVAWNSGVVSISRKSAV